jgi:hypothetical protein
MIGLASNIERERERERKRRRSAINSTFKALNFSL